MPTSIASMKKQIGKCVQKVHCKRFCHARWTNTPDYTIHMLLIWINNPQTHIDTDIQKKGDKETELESLCAISILGSGIKLSMPPLPTPPPPTPSAPPLPPPLPLKLSPPLLPEKQKKKKKKPKPKHNFVSLCYYGELKTNTFRFLNKTQTEQNLKHKSLTIFYIE